MPSTQQSGRIPNILAAFDAGLAYRLIGEHRVHRFGRPPLLSFQRCPLPHLILHRGHDRGHRLGRGGPSATNPSHPNQF